MRSHPAGRRITAIDGPDGRVEYAYDEAGQLVRAGESVWEYGDGGRLLREVVAGDETTFEYDAAGQLVASVRGGERTEYLYDGLGRRIRRTHPDGSTTEYAWSDLGPLTGVVSRDRSYGETGRIEAWIDVLGELAEVGGAEVWWDSAAALPAMVSIGGESVLDLPGGAVALGDAWATAGWRSARSTDASDPWAVLAAVEGAALPAGVSLTADGGLSIAGLEWLGARVYDPAARGFLSTDPLAPVLGAAWSGNPYSYAGNDPMRAIDPLGLRPATDEDLAAYRDANQSFLSRAANWVGDNWEYIAAGAAIVAGVALMFTGVGGPAGLALLAGSGALLSGGLSVASQKAQNGSVDWGRAGVDALVGGIGGSCWRRRRGGGGAPRWFCTRAERRRADGGGGARMGPEPTRRVRVLTLSMGFSEQQESRRWEAFCHWADADPQLDYRTFSPIRTRESRKPRNGYSRRGCRDSSGLKPCSRSPPERSNWRPLARTCTG